MKKLFSLWVLGLLAFWLTWCWTKNVEVDIDESTWDEVVEPIALDDEEEGMVVNPWNLNDVITYYLANNLGCNDGKSWNFVNIAFLWEKDLDDWYVDYYIYARGQWYYIDSRWNLTSSCWYAIPIKLNVNQEGWTYAVNDYETAKDWSEYMDSLKEMFSEEAIEKLTKEDYVFEDGRTLLEMAEESLEVKVIPEEKEEFDCSFCNKVWYYAPSEDEDWNSNELVFNYVAEDNWNNTIFFGTGWEFEAKGSWDEGKGSWIFWNNENTVIVTSSQNENVYDRYIITNQDDENLNTILEIIQRN